jgi:hypothetical protein
MKVASAGYKRGEKNLNPQAIEGVGPDPTREKLVDKKDNDILHIE